MRLLHGLVGTGFLLTALACAGTGTSVGDDGGGTTVDKGGNGGRGGGRGQKNGGRGGGAGECVADETQCRGAEFWRCTGGKWGLDTDCARKDMLCVIDDEGDPPFFGGGCSTVAMACPFVDVETDAGFVTVGEILRNLNRRALYGSQSLALPASAVRDGRIVLRLAERKPEITHLDAIWLEVGGRRIAPEACGEACRIDGKFDLLREGDARTFVFEDVGAGEPVLWAHGYYLPVPVDR